MQILERVAPDARNSIGVEQEELQRRHAVEETRGKLGNAIAVQNPGLK